MEKFFVSLESKVQHAEINTFNFQDHKILFDFDLSDLYDVETRTLKQGVAINPKDEIILFF